MTAQQKKILIVDDDIQTLKLVGGSLQKYGFEVSVLTDGYGVVSYCKQFKPDLVLLDVVMSYVKGSETMVKLNLAMPSQTVVAMSASEDYRGELLDCGAKAYLVKPISPEELIETIERVLGI